jgi:hypothetical protein
MDGASQFCFSRSTLEDAFTALTGTRIRADEAAFLDQVHEDCGPGEFPT